MAMIFWETLAPGIHVYVTLTRATFLHIVSDQVHNHMAAIFHHVSVLNLIKDLIKDSIPIQYQIPQHTFIGFVEYNTIAALVERKKKKSRPTQY